LDISKIEAGRFHLNRNEVRTAEFLDQIVDMVRLQATAKGIAFNYRPSPALPAVVYADENRLRQILINLLSNAIKFTEAGEVCFRIKYRYQVAEYEIEDTGIGIHQSDLERIFQPFEHARTAQTKATAGTGLGLTITKLLTNVMGGDITVTSEVGKGSIFRLKLLLSEVSRPRIASAQEDRVRGYVGPRQRLLVVDDNEIQRNLVRDMLAPLGFTVATSAGGRDCLSLAEREKPNLIFLDIAMPEMDGWQIASRLRQSSPERTAIVVLSANAIEPGRVRDAERLHDDYLMKPIDLRKLLKTIHALLNIEWIYGPEELPNVPAQTLPIRFPPPHDIDSLSASARSATSARSRTSWPVSSARPPNTRASSIRCVRS
jgi:CheY-like chemotaxis protein